MTNSAHSMPVSYITPVMSFSFAVSQTASFPNVVMRQTPKVHCELIYDTCFRSGVNNRCRHIAEHA